MRLSNKGDASFGIVKNNRERHHEISANNSRPTLHFQAFATDAEFRHRILKAISGELKPFDRPPQQRYVSASSHSTDLFDLSACEKVLVFAVPAVKDHSTESAGVEYE